MTLVERLRRERPPSNTILHNISIVTCLDAAPMDTVYVPELSRAAALLAPTYLICLAEWRCCTLGARIGELCRSYPSASRVPL
jgi:hypothetical protein